MVSTVGEGVVFNLAEMEYHHLSPCTHEEADSRILLHVADMARTRMTKIRVRTVDSDVVVICVAWFHDIPGLEELWIAKRLGAEKIKALHGFHVITGCDSVSAFYKRKGPWKVWKQSYIFFHPPLGLFHYPLGLLQKTAEFMSKTAST